MASRMRFARLSVLALPGIWPFAGGGPGAARAEEARVVVQVLETGPDGTGFFGSFSGDLPSLNNAGQAGFNHNLFDTAAGGGVFGGIFRGGGDAGGPAGGVVQIARTGQTVTGGDGTIQDLTVFTPLLNDAGQVAFRAFLAGTSGGSTDNAALYRGDGGPLVQVARKGQPDPGGNGTISNLDLTPALNNAGQVAFYGFLRGTAGGTADDRAIFRGDGGPLTTIVRDGQAAPGGTATFSVLTVPDLNEAGQVSFAALLNNGESGVYRGDGTSLVQVARTGQPAPGGNGTLGDLDLSAPPLGNGGHLIFRATLAGTSGGNADNSAIYRGDGGGPLVQVARKGQASPDGNGTFEGFAPARGVSDAGQTAFEAILTATDGGVIDSRGIYRGDGTELVQIARGGQPLPDGNGVFLGLSLPAINDAGQVAFIASFDNTSEGDPLDSGIYLYDDALGLVNLVRSGDALLGSTIDRLSFSSGSGVANGDGKVGFNDRGEVAFGFTLDDGRSGVAVIGVVPEPASLTLFMLGGMVLLRRGRAAERPKDTGTCGSLDGRREEEQGMGRTHDGMRRFLRAAWAAPAALLFLFVTGHALAAPLDPRYGAGVRLDNLGITLYEGQRSASGRVATGTDGAVITEGGADFSGSPASYVYATSAPGRGVIARAYLLDTATFDVAGGGFAEVPVRMAGTWRGVSAVEYFFVVGPTTYVGRGSSGVGESYVNGAPVPSVFTTALGGPGAEPTGNFLVDGRLSVADGGEYQIFAQVMVTAAEGDGGYMDDPLTIVPPAGVTFTSASGSTYAVPEPSALLWIAGGRAALARVRGRRRVNAPAGGAARIVNRRRCN